MFDSINPYNQELLAQFEVDNPQLIGEKLIQAENAFTKQKSFNIDYRCMLMLKVAEILTLRKIEFSTLICLEMGKTLIEAQIEIEKCIKTIHFYVENSNDLVSTKQVNTKANESYYSFEPIGTVLGIMPWNFPFWQVLRFVIPNIIIGNTVIIKHAPNVQLCAETLEQLFNEAGFEKNVYQNLRINVGDIENLIATKTIKGVTLTGSSLAGKSVAAAAGKNLKKSVLELGGSDPYIVLNDADIVKAAFWACKSRFQNAGQTCIAAKRWIVCESVFDNFKDEIFKNIVAIKTGNPLSNETFYGPLARKDLVINLKRQIDFLENQGANLIIKGSFENNLVAPSIIELSREISHDFSEELFGPAACLIKAKNENEAIKIANETSFGLGSSIWTTDIEKGKALGNGILAGSVYINSMVKSDAALPFGGINNSGYGRELSSYGLTEFTNIKSFWVEN